jgi:hypothetical protein
VSFQLNVIDYPVPTRHEPCAGKEVEETLRIVDKQTTEAAAQKLVVQGEEAVAAEKAAAAKAIKVAYQPRATRMLTLFALKSST